MQQSTVFSFCLLARVAGNICLVLCYDLFNASYQKEQSFRGRDFFGLHIYQESVILQLKCEKKNPILWL